MYELKLASGAAALYRAVIGLSIKLVHMRDRRAYKVYHRRTASADRMDTMAARLQEEADDVRDYANERINEHAREVNSALNTLENAKDDIPFRV